MSRHSQTAHILLSCYAYPSFIPIPQSLHGMTFSEESRPVMYGMGNVELFELGNFQQPFSASPV